MYIKNISQLMLGDLPIKLKIAEGNILLGKILFNEDLKGAIKLFDGTIIPAIFLSENDIEQNEFIKFKVLSFKDGLATLSKVEDNIKLSSTSMDEIISKLSIPQDKGQSIISSLIKFNLPATDENILTIYKNLKFIEKASDMPDSDILNFVNERLPFRVGMESKEFESAKNLFNLIKNIDVDFISFLIENNIPVNLDTVIFSNELLKDNFILNNLINLLSNKSHDTTNQEVVLTSVNPNPDLNENETETISQSSPLLISNSGNSDGAESESILKSSSTLNSFVSNNNYEPTLESQGSISTPIIINSIIDKLIKKIPELKEIFIENATKKFSKDNIHIEDFKKIAGDLLSSSMKDSNSDFQPENLRRFVEGFKVTNNILDNYSILNFNSHLWNNTFKNSIIIKNKYKKSNYVDKDNLKAFITVESPHIGVVEGYLHKTDNNLVVLIKTQNKFYNLFKKHIDELENSLNSKGYSSVNISIEKLEVQNNLVSLTSFFNDYGFQELDVKV